MKKRIKTPIFSRVQTEKALKNTQVMPILEPLWYNAYYYNLPIL
jgi:hypothetical protein